jgi:predicted GNAT family acetyltransferase
MRVRVIADASEFLAAAAPLLTVDEARHNLILGLASTLDTQPSLYAERRLWLVERAGRVVGAALQTPPWPLVLGRPASDEVLVALVDAIDDDLPGVVGARPEVEAFSDLWTTRIGTAARVKVAHGVYALSAVLAVPAPAGAPRAATPGDRPLLVDWWKAFAVEAVHDLDPDLDRIRQAVDVHLEDRYGGFLLWEDGEIVSLAGFGGRTPNGIRIGPVYTPPERRGRGYASALVAALSRERLAAGNRFCFLYTDLANPTSNAIYRRIGYEQVCESAEIEFTAAPGESHDRAVV